jgi:hypothetical protein
LSESPERIISRATVWIDYLRGERHVSSREANLFPSRAVVLAAAALACALPAIAQYPGQVTKPKDGQQLRSVAVLEWTGDEQHPKASRIVPVSIFDGQQLQDGGIYMARPEPLALEGEVEYQLKQNGKNVGLFVIQNAGQEQGSWVGYGAWKALPKPKPAQVAVNWKDDEDVASDQPVLHRKAHPGDKSDSGSSGSGTGSGSGSGSQGAPTDPDRPTLHRAPGNGGSGDSNSGTASAPSNGSENGSGSAPDPDRPTLHKSTSDSASSGSPNNGSSAGTAAGTDPDRPKLQKKNGGGQDEGYVSSLPDVTDPNRPRLVRGKSTDSGPTMMPSLVGLPPDMEQAVAVSDSRNTPEHIWSYSWANPEDEAKYKAQIEDLARTALGVNPPPAPAKKTSSKTSSRTSSAHKTQLTLPTEPAPLLDEQFHVFELAYGSGATMVLSAHTAGSGAAEKFITLVAQPDLYGSLVTLTKNVTDGAHLDDAPRMRLVDAVDAMADNRGELLFELRGATERQFALYRVLRGEMTQVFVSGRSELVAAKN